MSKTVLKWIFRTISGCITIVVIGLLVLQFHPQTYLRLISEFSPYKIHTDTVKVAIIPLSIKLTGLTVEDKKNNRQQLNLAHLFAKVSWKKLLSKHNNAWYLEVKNGEVTLFETDKAKANQSTQVDSNAAAKPLNIHNVLSSLNINANNIHLLIDKNTDLLISEFSTHLDKDNHRDSSDVKQNINLQLLYQQSGQKVAIHGTLDSENSQGLDRLTLTLDELDLRSLLANDTQTTTSKQDNNNQAIDWSWLNNIKKTAITLSINKLIFDKNNISDLNLNAVLDRGLAIRNLSSQVQWAFNESLRFDDRVSLSGHLKGREDGGIQTQLNFHFAANSLNENTPNSVNTSREKPVITANDINNKIATDFIAIDGIINPLALLDSHLTIEANISKLPFSHKTKHHPNIQQYTQFLPASINTQYQRNGKTYQLSDLRLTAGKTDLSGSVQATIDDGVTEIATTIKSNYIKYTSTETVPQAQPRNTDLFSKEDINWSWLDGYKINASLNAKKVDIDNYSFNSVDLPITLQTGNLAISAFSAKLENSNISGTVSIQKIGQQAKLTTKIETDDINISALNIIDDPKQLQGGSVSSNILLTSQGKSPHDIASALNGDILINIKNAVIGNDAFELIGSDLISELLSKLNPFAKSDPTTKLKCAVFNMPIKDGIVSINNSIAAETSKVTIVANGNINLNDETLLLDLKPTPTSGVGINAGNLVKFMTIGGKLNAPRPIVSTKGLLKTGAALGAAISTGGATVIADSLLSKTISQNACSNALKNR